jgi:hypothetical protein
MILLPAGSRLMQHLNAKNRKLRRGAGQTIASSSKLEAIVKFGIDGR